MNTSKSLTQLKLETEQTRAAFADTVKSLRMEVSDTAREFKEKVSPTHIKEHLLATVERKMRENPMQAAAIGTAIAYPLWKILRSIPVPVLMIGAGVLMTRPDRARGDGLMHASRERVGEGASMVRDMVAEGAANVREAGSQASEKLASTLSNAGAVASSQIDAARDQLGQAVKSAGRTASEALSPVKDVLSSAYDTAASTADSTVQQTKAAISTTRDGLSATIESNPLIVGGIGLLMGAALAAVLPRSSAEVQLLGKSSADLKKRGFDAISEGVETVKDVAGKVYEEAVRAAEDQGLTGDAMQETAQHLKGKIASVADGTTNAALNGMPKN